MPFPKKIAYKQGKKGKRENESLGPKSSDPNGLPSPCMTQALFRTWRPKHHTCGVCDTKLDSPQGRRSCIPKKHEGPCPRYHETLMMPHEVAKCIACKSLDEANRRREAAITKLENAIEADAFGENQKKRDNARQELVKLKETHAKSNEMERLNTALREVGFWAWLRGGKG